MNSSRAHSTALEPITVIGSGRMGNVIAKALNGTGRAATLVGRDGLEEACVDAELVLLCVPDEEIDGACKRVVAAAEALRYVGHTSGASRLDVLSAATRLTTGAFSVHPLQTIPSAEADLGGAPAAIAGSSTDALELARNLARSCRMVPFEVPEDSRAAYHAAASIASNFLIALEVSAEQLLGAAGIEDGRRLLTPLVLRSAQNWAELGPMALTGPIARGDEATVSRHLEAITELAPELGDTYKALADRTRTIASSGVSR